ncbi:MAG: YicC family protein [Clostridia bacterium]|nr:YicC family protein [Clostridia bacterium]
MYSMTGYGKGVASRDGRTLTVELKSVNHRFLDVSMRLPRSLSFLEDTFRSELAAGLSRGHVDVYLNYSNTREDAKSIRINGAFISAYVAAAREANEQVGLRDDLTLSSCLRLPDVVEITEGDEDTAAVTELAREAVRDAILGLRQMRLLEGERLKQDFSARAETILSLTEEIAKRAPSVVEEYREKLNARIEQLLGAVEVDRARLATEVALFADRAAIDEEIVRLRSHVAQMQLLLSSEEPVGRKLDFVVQEMNREFNTIGSKANDAALTNLVLSGKAEVEKFREQVQNIE